MTSIVGISRDGKVYIGGDSCGSGGQTWMHISSPKVFINGQFMFGCCGSFRMMDLLRYSLSVEPQNNKQNDAAYVRTTFISALRRLFKEAGFLRDSPSDRGGNFLLGYRGNLYEVQDDFSVLDTPDWGHSIGTGEAAARGSLFTTRGDWDCFRRVEQALAAAEAVTPSVRGPFVTLDF
jgi:hypothetical protein